MESSNELIEAPRFFSTENNRDSTQHVLIISGLDETEKDYERLISLLEEDFYRVGLYIPKSEDKDFDGNFLSSQMEFVRFLKNWNEQEKPSELHLIGHSMAYALVMNSFLENKELAKKISSLSFTNPMLRLKPLYEHLLPQPLQEPIKLRLSTPLSPDHLLQVQIQRSKEFIEGYENFSSPIGSILEKSNWLISTQILVSRDDPNIEMSLIKNQWKGRANLISLESARHNLLRKPETHRVNQALLEFFQSNSGIQNDSSCQKTLKKL